MFTLYVLYTPRRVCYAFLDVRPYLTSKGSSLMLWSYYRPISVEVVSISQDCFFPEKKRLRHAPQHVNKRFCAGSFWFVILRSFWGHFGVHWRPHSWRRARPGPAKIANVPSLTKFEGAILQLEGGVSGPRPRR